MRTDSKKARDVHETALRQFDRIQDAMREEREQSLQDRRFYSIAGAQWEGHYEQQFKNKPMMEVNKVHLAVIKIINEYRNNRVTVDFIAKDGSTNSDLATVCANLFRADEQDSSAQEAYDNAFEEAVGGGIGAFRVVNEYEDEGDPENEKQRIRIEPIYDADSSVYFDIDAKKQDKSDARYCFVVYSTSPEDFEQEWGEPGTSVQKQVTDTEFDWNTPELIYFAEYYRVEETKQKLFIYKTLDGREKAYSEEDFEEDEELERRISAQLEEFDRERTITKKKVHKYIISGNKMLEDCGYIAGTEIPIIPTYGKRWFVDSIERCMGHVRLVKDAQRLKNMLVSKMAEISASSSIEKPIFTPEQMEGHNVAWSEDNIENYPYLLINPITAPDGNEIPSGPIGYTKSPDIPQSIVMLAQLLDIDMQELLGNTAQADKMLSHVSGKAHEMIQKRIDGQAYIYMDNFAKAIRRLGQVWLSMAREVYVEKGRKMKTVDTMDQVGSVELQAPGMADDGALVKNDLTKATFDVNVDVGPSSASQREAAVQVLINMMGIAQDPQNQQVLQSLALYNMEGEGISQARQYFRKQLVGMGVLPPTEEEAQALANQEPSAQDQALLAMAAKDQADAAKTQAEMQKIQAEIVEILSDVDLNKAKSLEVYSEIEAQQLAEAISLMEQLRLSQQPSAMPMR